ncbi:hemerythrin domain-containing protein, partial [Escherichia coli]|nr:hemerythrin domain-containing protein [Escherichia coli]
DPSLQAAVQRLQADHHAMEALWARLRVVLQDVAEGRCQRWPDADRANHDTEAGVPAARRSEVEAFLALYEQHIALEEGQVFPAARAAMDA